MAAAKKNEKPQDEKNVNKLDLAKFLPKGFTLDDFEVVGGLRPICPPELNQDAPIVGYVVSIIPMPKRKSDKSDWDCLLVTLLSTAQAKTSDGEIVTLEEGEDVLIPIGGSLKNNAGLLSSACDARKVVPGIFTVIGQVDTGKPSDMWEYEVRLAFKKAVPREGKFALYNKPVFAISNGAVTPGEVVNRDGSTARLVG